jgi:hypothetical protein
LLKAVRESKSIAILAGNPLLLTMMAVLNRNQELPRDRTDLYAQASRVLLHQWDTERALEDFPGMSNEIGLREKNDILRRIAAHMQAGPSGLKGNLINGPTLTDLIEDYLQNELHVTQARAVARAVVDQLRQRNFILCFVGADSYAFVHRTFLEYFCATDFVHQFNVAKTLDIEGLVALFDRHCRDDEWREVLRLICGQIDERFVGRIVEHLTVHAGSRSAGKGVIPQLPLAIFCLLEVRSPKRLEVAGKCLLRRLVRMFKENEGYGSWDEIIAASREIGGRWPGVSEEDIEHHPKSFAEKDRGRVPSSIGKWPFFVAFVFELRETVERMALHGIWLARSAALQALAEKWPDQTTRDLLAQRVVQDKDGHPRCAALQLLAEKWPDQTARDLLAQRAVQDKDSSPRSAALLALGMKLPDQITRDLLTQRAVQDKNSSSRSAALLALARKWPDQTTRDLLAQRVVQDKDGHPRGAALLTLAEKWPDQTTRDLLTQCAVQDGNEDTRSIALWMLAAKWSDQTTRDLLTQRAVQDKDDGPRSIALDVLAEEWSDQTTRDLLTQRAVQDKDGGPRSTALRELARKWPDQTTRDLLAKRAGQDSDNGTRGVACWTLGKMHSEFGRILPTRDLNGMEPYLDPLEPISRKHIEKAAAKVGIRSEDIDATVVALSAHLGWDITRGAKKDLPIQPTRSTRGGKKGK